MTLRNNVGIKTKKHSLFKIKENKASILFMIAFKFKYYQFILSKAMKEEDQELNCPICFEQFKEINPPMVLCRNQHIACASCVQNLFKEKNKETDGIKCPECKGEVRYRNITQFIWYHRFKDISENLKSKINKLANQNQNFIIEARKKEYNLVQNEKIDHWMEYLNDQFQQSKKEIRETSREMMNAVTALRNHLKEEKTNVQTQTKNMVEGLSARMQQNIKREIQKQEIKIIGLFSKGKEENKQFQSKLYAKFDEMTIQCRKSQKVLQNSIDDKINQALQLIFEDKSNRQFQFELKKKVEEVLNICSKTNLFLKRQITEKLNKNIDLKREEDQLNKRIENNIKNQLSEVKKICLQMSQTMKKQYDEANQKNSFLLDQNKKERKELKYIIENNIDTIESLKTRVLESLEHSVLKKIDELNQLISEGKIENLKSFSLLKEDTHSKQKELSKLILQKKSQNQQLENFIKSRMDIFERERTLLNEKLMSLMDQLQKNIIRPSSKQWKELIEEKKDSPCSIGNALKLQKKKNNQSTHFQEIQSSILPKHDQIILSSREEYYQSIYGDFSDRKRNISNKMDIESPPRKYSTPKRVNSRHLRKLFNGKHQICQKNDFCEDLSPQNEQ